MDVLQHIQRCYRIDLRHLCVFVMRLNKKQISVRKQVIRETIPVDADITLKPHGGVTNEAGPRLAGQLGVIHEPHCTRQATTFIADLMVCLISF